MKWPKLFRKNKTIKIKIKYTDWFGKEITESVESMILRINTYEADNMRLLQELCSSEQKLIDIRLEYDSEKTRKKTTPFQP